MAKRDWILLSSKWRGCIPHGGVVFLKREVDFQLERLSSLGTGCLLQGGAVFPLKSVTQSVSNSDILTSFWHLSVIFLTYFCHLYINFLSYFCHHSVLLPFCLFVFVSFRVSLFYLSVIISFGLSVFLSVLAHLHKFIEGRLGSIWGLFRWFGGFVGEWDWWMGRLS